MKKVFCLLIFIVGFTLEVVSQASLWGSYKYTDGVHLAPSQAGYKGGAVALSYRSSWTKVEGAPKSVLLVAHTSLLQEKAGVGVVLNQENNNVLEHFQIQIPLAYHLKINKSHGVSFGLTPDIVQSRLDHSKVTNKDISSDDFLNSYDNSTQLDFGFSYQLNHKYYEFGLSVQRVKAYSTGDLPAKMYLFANAFIPLRDAYDLIEPTLIVSRDNNGEWLATGYLYYKFIEKVIVGAGYQTNKNTLLSAGYSFDNRIVVGYNFAFQAEQKQMNLGNTHEITVRVNLNQRYYDQRKYSIFAKPIRMMKQR